MECIKCKITLPDDAAFCFKCGKPQKATSKLPLLILVVVVILGFLLKDNFLGEKPSQFESLRSDPKIDSLRQKASLNPSDINAWRDLAYAAQENIDKDQTYVFDLLEALRGILNINPQDKDALLGMAEISYSQQAFDKAAQFYKTFLEIEPENNQVKANYASSLTFLGKMDEAKSILKEILEKDPKNFQAGAYLAIAFARNKEIDEAKRVGEETLKYAPDDEAIKRFGKFLASLDNNGKAAPPASVVDTPRGELLQFFYNHPIVGPKIKSHSFKDSELIIEVENFPMSAMPQNARATFERNIRSKIPNDIKKVVLLEKGVVLGEISP